MSVLSRWCNVSRPLQAGVLVAGSAWGALAAPPQTGQAAPPPAPPLLTPANGAVLPLLALDLTWSVVAGATVTYEVQVAPFRNDGPGIDVWSDGPRFQLPVPDPVKGPFILLPDMTYTWRVRATTSDLDNRAVAPEWGPWSEDRTFRTPRASAQAATLVEPGEGAFLGPSEVLLRWAHTDLSLFYWEVQVSPDSLFDTNPATAKTFVWWNLVHGRVQTPPNAWRTPQMAVGTYYWRVRPRIQGDGIPVAWGPAWRFTIVAGGPVPTPPATPAPSVTATPAGTPGSGAPTPGPSGTPSPGVTPRPSGTPAATGYRLAFESARDGNLEIYTVKDDGSALTNATKNAAVDRLAAYSPDGSMLAFSSNRDFGEKLMVMTSDGKVLVGDTVMEFSKILWSPDGKRIAAFSDHDGLKLFDTGGRLDRALVDGTSNIVGSADWSADSTQLVVSVKARGTSDPYKIYVITIIGNTQALIRDPAPFDNTQAVWIRSTNQLVFVSAANGNKRIWLSDPRGTVNSDLSQQSNGDDDSPAVAPTGTRIAFVSRRDGNREVYVMERDGSHVANLSNNPGEDYNPVWSPDGKKIAFMSDRDGNQEVYVMNGDGSNQMNVSRHVAIDRNPAWGR